MTDGFVASGVQNQPFLYPQFKFFQTLRGFIIKWHQLQTSKHKIATLL